jgi:hypothetical protein
MPTKILQIHAGMIHPEPTPGDPPFCVEDMRSSQPYTVPSIGSTAGQRCYWTHIARAISCWRRRRGRHGHGWMIVIVSLCAPHVGREQAKNPLTLVLTASITSWLAARRDAMVEAGSRAGAPDLMICQTS